MKLGHPLALTALATVALLASCGEAPASSSASSYVGPSDTETLRGVDILVQKEDKVIKGGSFNLLFKAKSEIPYIAIEEGFAFLNATKAEAFSDAKNERHYYRLSQEGNKTIVTDEHGEKATLDLDAQTIAYTDLDTFLGIVPDGTKPLSIYNPKATTKAIKIAKSEFTKGKAVTLDLKPYPGVDLYQHNGKTYLPLATFNDAFFSIALPTNFAYNYKDIYMIPAGGLTTTFMGVTSLSPLGESYYGNAKKMATLSDEIRNFNFQETCFKFDYFYGLKDVKGYSSFASFIESKQLKEDILSADPRKSDSALRYALSHLVDGHTSGAAISCLYEYGTASDDSSKYNAERSNWMSGSSKFQQSRPEESKLGNKLEEVGKVYYIGFNDFIQIDEDIAYFEPGWADASVVESSTALLFHDAYTFLTNESNKGKASTVVVDLSTNDGGAADALIYSLCTLLGEVKTVMQNPLTGAVNHTSYRADLNLDGKIDEKDISLSEKGYDIVILSSEYTFSSGNALPAIAKYNSSKVMTIGEKSGGGACAVNHGFSPIGANYAYSSLSRISTESDGKITHVDGGVPADHAVEKQSMFDRLFVSTMVNSWLGK